MRCGSLISLVQEVLELQYKPFLNLIYRNSDNDYDNISQKTNLLNDSSNGFGFHCASATSKANYFSRFAAVVLIRRCSIFLSASLMFN